MRRDATGCDGMRDNMKSVVDQWGTVVVDDRPHLLSSVSGTLNRPVADLIQPNAIMWLPMSHVAENSLGITMKMIMIRISFWEKLYHGTKIKWQGCHHAPSLKSKSDVGKRKSKALFTIESDIHSFFLGKRKSKALFTVESDIHSFFLPSNWWKWPQTLFGRRGSGAIAFRRF